VLQIPHEEQSIITPPPASHGVVKHGALQLQTSPQAQEGEQVVVTLLQVTCPGSPAAQLRSAPEQVAPEHWMVTEPQRAEQVAFGAIRPFDAKMAPSGAALPGPMAVEGLESTDGTTGGSLGV
jgi:hypothetical protein